MHYPVVIISNAAGAHTFAFAHAKDAGTSDIKGSLMRRGCHTIQGMAGCSVYALSPIRRKSIPFGSHTLEVMGLTCKHLKGSACATKFCYRDFVLKYVVIGKKKKDFQEESGLFRDLFWSRSGPFVVICTKMQNCLKL